MVKPAAKPSVSKEEEKYRKSNCSDIKKILNKNLLCTSCNGSVKQLVLKGKPRCHPFMDTLLCDKCYTFFGDGEFSVDEDGSDKYCRWCGQGGTLFLCSQCTAGFCKKCIKRNLPRSALKEVEDDDWECFCCNVKPLYELRGYCWAALKYAEEKKNMKNEENNKKRKSRKSSVDSDAEDNDSDDSERASKKPKLREKSKRSRNKKDDDDDDEEDDDDDKSHRSSRKSGSSKKSNKERKLYKKITSKLQDVMNDAIQISDKVKSKALDCKKNMSSLKSLKDMKSVDNAAQSVVNMLEQIETICTDLKSNFQDYFENWKKDLLQELSNKENQEALENENAKAEKNVENGVAGSSIDEDKAEEDKGDEDKANEKKKNYAEDEKEEKNSQKDEDDEMEVEEENNDTKDVKNDEDEEEDNKDDDEKLNKSLEDEDKSLSPKSDNQGTPEKDLGSSEN